MAVATAWSGLSQARIRPNVQRLKSRPQFQAALAGRTLSRTPHFALHCCSLAAAVAPVESAAAAPLFPHDDVWVGAMVPKRWAKRAVTRNAIKRQIYNVSAGLEGSLAHQAHVVRLRVAFDGKLFHSATSEALKRAVRAELSQLFSRAAQLP